MTPADLFHRAGLALFGDQYVAPMAQALSVEKGTVRNWASGKSRIPYGIWTELSDLVVERRGVVDALALALHEVVISGDVPKQKSQPG